MKKLILIGFLILIFLPFVSSSWEWDNVGIDYDEKTKTIKVRNAFGLGEDIANITLDSPLIVNVIRGEDRKVAEFTINNVKKYRDVFNNMEFYNIKEDMKDFERDFTYKYKSSLGKFDVNDYETICIEKEFENKTKYDDCYNEIIGTHKEERFEWVGLDTSKELPKGKTTIGVFTDVYTGDNVEWIPTFFGVEIDEWAVWTESLNVGLVGYWALNSSSGTTAYDSQGNYNGTLHNMQDPADWVAGHLGNALNFDGATDYVNVTSSGALDNYGSGNFSYCFWAKTHTESSINVPLSKRSVTYPIEVRYGSGNGIVQLNTPSAQVIGTTNISDGTYHFTCGVRNTALGKLILYVDGSHEKNETDTGGDLSDSINLTIGKKSLAVENFTGDIDEVGLWNRTISAAEITQLWNGGTGITFIPSVVDATPTVTLNSPVVEFNTTNPTIDFNCTASDNFEIINVSLLINGSIEQTNSSGINATDYLFTEIITAGVGFYNWTCIAFDNSSQSTTPSARYFTYSNDLTVSIDFPFVNFNSSSATISFNGSASDDTAIINVSLYINGTLNETNSSGMNATEYNFTKTLGDGELNWTFEACDAISCLSAATRNLTVDTTAPTINITYPTATIDHHLVNTNQTLNWNATDIHIDACWYNYNFINVTVTCDVNTTNFTLTSQRNITLYANDTFGNEDSDFQEWDYKVFENSQTFNNKTIEGSMEIFYANITLGSGESISSVSFDYNGTSQSASQVSLGGNIFNLTSTFTILSVTADVNITFFWIIDLASGQVNSSSNNQTVKNLAIDNCSTHTTVIFNYTMIDEEDQTQLTGSPDNTTLDLSIEIFNLDKSVSVLNLSTSYNQTNPVAVCLSINLTNNTIYALDSTIKYQADDYAIEYYNIQNFTLQNSSIPQEINLFDLLTADSTEFQITFKDSNFVVVENALIQIQRQYVAEGLFKTVEIPKTDSNGQTVVHLVEKDIVYNIIVLKEGVILGTFNNIIAFCEDALVGSCFISLNALEAGEKVFDYDEEIGLISSFDYDETTRILQYDFSTTDGGVKNVSLSSIKMDMLGNTSVCDTFLVSASGSLYCPVPASIGNETIIVKIYVDGDLKITNYVSGGTEFDIGDAGFFLMFFLVLSLALMMTESKIAVIIGVVLGFIASSLLSLYKGGIMGVGSSLIWLMIMAIILIWKLNSDRQT